MHAGRLRVQRGLDRLRHPFVVDRARLAQAHVVVQAGDVPLDEARAPPAKRVNADRGTELSSMGPPGCTMGLERAGAGDFGRDW